MNDLEDMTKLFSILEDTITVILELNKKMIDEINFYEQSHPAILYRITHTLRTELLKNEVTYLDRQIFFEQDRETKKLTERAQKLTERKAAAIATLRNTGDDT